MKTLVTGISGFLAGYIACRYQQTGHDVIGVHHSPHRPTGRANRFYQVHLPHNDIYRIIKMEKPDVVVHAAGTSSVPFSIKQPYTDFSVSVPATAILLDAIRKYAPNARFIFLSSAAVYGNPSRLPVHEQMETHPISPYGYHKLMGEALCREYADIYNIESVVLRIFSAYGPELTKQVIFDIIRKFSEQDEVHLHGSGNESRDFIHARDIASAIHRLSSIPFQNVVYNLASGTETTIFGLAQLIKQKLASDKPIRFNGKKQPGKPDNWVADISKIKALGFYPKVSLPEGIETAINQLNTYAL